MDGFHRVAGAGRRLPAWLVYSMSAGMVMVGLAIPWGLRWSGALRSESTVVEPREDGRAHAAGEQREARALRPKMLILPGGRFLMGSPEGEEGRDDDEGPQHGVTISPFAICETEVTQSQYEAVMGTKPSNCDYGCGDELPVQNVSWFDTLRYLNRLTALDNTTREGENDKLSPCYEGVPATDPELGSAADARVTWVPGCTGYRLPTEAEWEYAARAGSTGPYGFEGGAEKLGEHAWFDENAGGKVHPVGEKGEKAANAWFLLDMHGNVWEWVWDWYGEKEYGKRAGKEPVVDPSGPESGRLSRVLRGGSFDYGARYLRSAFRDGGGPSVRNGRLGFRCVRRGAQHRSSTP